MDANLMMLLVRCLAAEPAHRPSLRELVRWARWRQAEPDMREGQDETRAWSDEHIRQAPIVRNGPSTSSYFSNFRKLTPCLPWQKPPPRAPESIRTGLAAIGTDVMDRLTEAAGMLRIGGLANRAEKAEQSLLHRAEPVEDLRLTYQEQEGFAPPEGVQRAPLGWWNTVVQSRIAQVQNLLNVGLLPSQADQPPPRPLRRSQQVDDPRARFQQDAQRQAQAQQAPQNASPRGLADELRGENNPRVERPRGILRSDPPARDLRVRFANNAGSRIGRGLRRRPQFNDIRGRYQQDGDDDLAL